MLAKPGSQMVRSKTTMALKKKPTNTNGNFMDSMFGAPSHTNDLDQHLVKEMVAKQKAEAAEKEREMAIEAKKKQKVNA